MVQCYCTLQLALRLVVLFQALIPTLTQSTCNAAAALQKCEQVEKISIASQATPCEYRRVFYNCMLLEGCYYNAACRQDQNAVVCSELCEAETILPTCVHEQNLPPPQDYHLCPHIPKDLVSTQAPTLDDFLAAPALPYTLTAGRLNGRWLGQLASSLSQVLSWLQTHCVVARMSMDLIVSRATGLKSDWNL
eukprot:symbB.v1.2.039546.t1/scaffold6622.1/size16656/2